MVEVQPPVRGEDLERIEVRAVASRRIGWQLGGLQEGVATKVLSQPLMVRVFEQALVKRGELRRKVPGQQVNQGLALGASGSSTISTRLAASSGAPRHISGGEICSPPSLNAGLSRVMVSGVWAKASSSAMIFS